MTPTDERYHSLDFLRATVMFLGIMLHGMLPFMTIPVPFWPAHDIDRSPAADLFVFVVHDFRMQTFFFLAGFFGCLLYQRYGLAGMIRHRLVRIVLPFGLGLILIEPTLQAVWFFGNPSALKSVGLSIEPGESIGQRVLDHFTSGRFLEYIYPFHLWFLYFLTVFFVVMIPLVGIGNRLVNSRLDRSVGNRLTGRGGVFILAALTTPLLWPMKVWGMADTAEGWLPRACIFTYYFIFFFWGWLMWRYRERLNEFSRHWVLSLLIGNLLVLPIMLGLIYDMLNALQGLKALPGASQHAATCFSSAMYTWLMIAGLIGAFRHWFHRERRWVRYLADASYWCYLWHLTPIIVLQILLASSHLPGLLKFLIIIGATMAILLASYEWCVRYTLIGAMLNGRKYRRKSPPRRVSSVANA